MTDCKKPLQGLKVLDFTRVYSGPYCTMMMGDLGADIIKVERKGVGDDTHYFGPMKNDESGYFTYFNRNKKSLSLDLKAPESIEIIKELAEWADIVVENFSPGVMDRLGIGYEDLKERNPKIIYGSISGFGQTGPYRKKPAYDIVCQAMGGFMALTGEKDGKPYKVGPSVADALAGIHMAFAIMAAVHHREETGEGQFIDVAMMDTAFSVLENFVVTKTLTGEAPTRNGNANLGSAPFNTFRTKDGYVAIACANNGLFTKLAKAIDREDLLDVPEYAENNLRKEHEDTLNPEIEKWTMERTAEEAVEILDAAKVPVGPILGIDDLVKDPQLKARNMLVDIDHPVLGKVAYHGNPLKFSETSELCFEPAPLLGQHNDYILKEVLGLDEDKIQQLKEKELYEHKEQALRSAVKANTFIHCGHLSKS